MRATHSPSRSARSAGGSARTRARRPRRAFIEERAPPVERELRRDELGLVRDDERERGVRLERRGRGEDDGFDRVRRACRPRRRRRARGRRGSRPRGRGRRAAGPGGRGSSGRRWPGRSRLPWRRRRGWSWPRRPGRRTRAAASRIRSATGPGCEEEGAGVICMRQYCADRLIVSTCQASHPCSRSASSPLPLSEGASRSTQCASCDAPAGRRR